MDDRGIKKKKKEEEEMAEIGALSERAEYLVQRLARSSAYTAHSVLASITGWKRETENTYQVMQANSQCWQRRKDVESTSRVTLSCPL